MPWDTFRSQINHIFISANSFHLLLLDEKWQISSTFWHKFKTPLGRPSEMANLEAVDVRKSIFWRKSGSQIFLVSACPCFLTNLDQSLKVVSQFKGQQKPEKFDHFSSKSTFSNIKTIYFVHFRGCPQRRLEFMLKECSKSVIFLSKSCK